MVDENVPGIKEFFKGRDVFITGGTGEYLLFLNGNQKKCVFVIKIEIFLVLRRFYGESVD